MKNTLKNTLVVGRPLTSSRKQKGYFGKFAEMIDKTGVEGAIEYFFKLGAP